MKLIRWSLDHPLPVLLGYAALLLLAALALALRIPVRLTPALPSPLVGVVTEAMGLSPEQVEERLTSPLERQLLTVPGVRSVRSQSMAGMSLITCEFPWGTPPTQALACIRASLPEGRSRVLEIDPLNQPVLRLAVRSARQDLTSLRRELEERVIPGLKSLPGVDTAYAFGGLAQVGVMVDRERLAARGLSLLDLRQALEGALVSGAGAALDAPQGREAVQLGAGPATLAELGDLVVGAQQGRSVSLKQVASLAWEPGPARYRCNGLEAVELNVIARPEASAPATVKAVREALRELPWEFEVAFDNASFVSLVARDVWLELGLAVVLTALVVHFFLGDPRATLVALATIPCSLAMAVVLFVPLGLSLNSSTLVGLLLAIGRLVDDTIIDLHAVRRHRLLGKNSREAALDGCSEVRRAVVSATGVITLSMLPLTVAGGLVQAMFAGLVWPYLLALAASLLVALTLTPVLCVWAWRDRAQTPASRWEPALASLERSYQATLARALGARGLVLGSFLAALYLAGLLFPLIGSEMMPLADTAQLYGVLEARAGSSPAETTRLVAQVEAIARRYGEVVSVSSEIGWEPPVRLTGYEVPGGNGAALLITLSPRDQRQRAAWDVADALRAEVERSVAGLRRMTFKEMGSDVMASSMAPVQVVVKGPDLARLDWLASSLADLARGWSRAHPGRGLAQVATAWGLEQPGWELKLDREALAARGLEPRQVGQEALEALGGGSGTLRLRDGTPVMLAYRDSQRQGERDLARVQVAPGLTLGQVARWQARLGPGMIEHDNLQRSNSVMGSYRPGGPGSMQLSMDLLMAARMQLAIPEGYSLEQRGDMLAMMESFQRLLRGLAVALLLIYLGLAGWFSSLRLPLVIMAAIPLELPGVFAALLLAGQTFSSVSLLGLVVLSGIDLTASILLVDALRQGLDPVSRLRPLLMTVVVTLAVMLPLAVAPRPGMDAYAPLATVVIGGLLSSTLLTLFAVPVLYSCLEGPYQNRRTSANVQASDPSPTA